MIEAIILSTLTFIGGFLVGAFISLSDPLSKIKRIKLDSGKELGMWKGFVDPALTFVAANTGGDVVVFDKNGYIIHVELNVKE